jgi:DNA-binding MarR family transcriptional regulator
MNLDNHPELVGDLIHSLRKLSTRMVLFQQKAAHNLGVVHTDFKTADILNETGPITAGELAKITGLTTGSVTALLDRLEHAGYINREKDPNDRRRVIIVPVKNKQKPIAEHYAPLNKAMTELCSQYNVEELSLIMDFINRTIQIHEQEIKEPNQTQME